MINAAIFAVLTLAVSYFGLTVIEYAGFQEFDRSAEILLSVLQMGKNFSNDFVLGEDASEGPAILRHA